MKSVLPTDDRYIRETKFLVAIFKTPGERKKSPRAARKKCKRKKKGKNCANKRAVGREGERRMRRRNERERESTGNGFIIFSNVNLPTSLAAGSDEERVGKFER